MRRSPAGPAAPTDWANPDSASIVGFLPPAINCKTLAIKSSRVATREDLMASVLQLMGGGKKPTIDAESGFAQSVGAAGPAGDLRMVLNLEKIVPSPYFRSYWVQENISGMKSYTAVVSDLFRSGKEYREERVLLKKAGEAGSTTDNGKAVSD